MTTAVGAPLASEEPPPEEAPPAAATVTCASCGNEEPEAAQFCGVCGASLAAGADDEWVAAPAALDGEPALPSAEPVARPRRRIDRRVWVPALVVLTGGAAVAALFGTGVIGGETRKSEEAFVSEVNDRVLGPLGLADETAAAHAEDADPATGPPTDRGSSGRPTAAGPISAPCAACPPLRRATCSSCSAWSRRIAATAGRLPF